MAKKNYNIEILFKALADRTRLRLISLIGDSEVCVCFFVAILKVSQPKISRHLAYLRRAGIVTARREGKWMHYRLSEPPDEHAVARAMLTETTTIGVRVRTERRHVLPRTLATVETPFGPVRVKRAGTNGETRTRAEYDDLLRIARDRNLPLPEAARVVDASIQGETAT